MPRERAQFDADAAEPYFRTLFHAVPSPVLIVDSQVRIQEYNAAAAALLGPQRAHHLLKRGGEVMHCIHALETPAGCGGSESCGECVVRNSVEEVFRTGKSLRRRTRMSLRSAAEGEVTAADFLVTAAPFSHAGSALVLLILEDITELALLRGILPICSHCKKIRNDRNYWESVDQYLRKHADLEFTHSVCEECFEKHYGEFLRRAPGKSQPPSRSR